MNAGFELAPAAKIDLLEIWNYIALEKGNRPAANRLWSDIEAACQRLGEFPSLGHRRPDLSNDPDVLFYCVREYYLVIYRKGTSPLQVARVIHGARDVATELR